MSELISELHTIEHEADGIIREARARAKEILAGVADRVDQRRTELDHEFHQRRRTWEDEARRNSEAELAEVHARFDRRLQRLEQISDEAVSQAAETVLERIHRNEAD
jgi:vacuolar-type H+-ATPase subunit H